MMNEILDTAIVNYGKSQTIEDFIVDLDLNMFRINLFNIYSQKEFMRHTINIKEVTWATDSVNRFTVWYEVLNDTLTIAKDSCSYDIYTDF